jgi:hypothetical protein
MPGGGGQAIPRAPSSWTGNAAGPSRGCPIVHCAPSRRGCHRIPVWRSSPATARRRTPKGHARARRPPCRSLTAGPSCRTCGKPSSGASPDSTPVAHQRQRQCPKASGWRRRPRQGQGRRCSRRGVHTHVSTTVPHARRATVRSSSCLPRVCHTNGSPTLSGSVPAPSAHAAARGPCRNVPPPDTGVDALPRWPVCSSVGPQGGRILASAGLRLSRRVLQAHHGWSGGTVPA